MLVVSEPRDGKVAPAIDRWREQKDVSQEVKERSDQTAQKTNLHGMEVQPVHDTETGRTEHDAKHVVLEYMMVPPAVTLSDIARVPLDEFWVFADPADVVDDVADLDLREAFIVRAMWITVFVAEKMMHTMPSVPFSFIGAAGKPDAELEKPSSPWREFDRAMSRSTMQIDGGR